ncbi:MAG: LacI family DNA-binding transcriptional regulator [Gemmatimonadota bacterium]
MSTIKDVARVAGVSIATVSRVYNGSLQVRESTRQHVREIAIQLDYSPHGAARSLIMSETRTLGALLPDLYGEFFSEVIRGIDQTAQKHGFHLLVSSSHAHRPSLEAAIRSMRGRVDGLIVMSPERYAQPPRRAGAARRLPIVLLNSPAEGEGVDVITIANVEGARSMVAHLIGRGHRRIGIIGGAAHNIDAEERLQGYRNALRDAGLEPDARYEVTGDFSEKSGYSAAFELADRDPRPTAIFAANDAMAIGALSALRSRGLRIPEEIAVAGFDDIPMARYVDPPLSSVHVNISALGARAAERLLFAIRHATTHAPQRETLPTTLVLRGSTEGTTVQ